MLETALESSDPALHNAAISVGIGDKTKDLWNYKKSRNCGKFDPIFP